jgi:hypothetical protein
MKKENTIDFIDFNSRYKNLIINICKIILLSIIFFILRTIIFAGFFQIIFNLPKPDIKSSGLLLFFNYLICVIFTLVLIPIVFRSTLSRKNLWYIIAIILIGIPIVINQIEAFFFKDSVNMSSKELLVYSLGNICAALIFSFIIIKVFKRIVEADTKATFFLVSRKQFLWKIPLAAFIIYPFIYLFFGSLLFSFYAPVKEFYSQLEIPNQSFILLFQLLRGLLWMIPGILTFSHIKGKKVHIAFITGLIFAIFMSIEILVPVNFMPLKVRVGHFIELFISHFIWGFILVYLFRNSAIKKNEINTFKKLNV